MWLSTSTKCGFCGPIPCIGSWEEIRQSQVKKDSFYEVHFEKKKIS